jgi:hypothetical protein
MSESDLAHTWYAPEEVAPSEGPAPAFQRGWLVCHRLFDIGDEIALEELVSRLANQRVHRMTIGGKRDRAFDVSVAPVGVDLGTRPLPALGPLGVKTRIRAHFFNYGVASIAFEAELPPATLDRLVTVVASVRDSAALTEAARGVLSELLPLARDTIRGTHADDYECLTLLYLQALAPGVKPTDILRWPALGKLLAGETAKGDLDPRHRDELLTFAYSYLEDDLVVIDYDTALVVESSGARDIPILLELACSQLLALRYYDRALDNDMRQIYDELTALDAKVTLFRSRYGGLARRVVRRMVEVREFSDLIGNSIKVVGDVYLARTYRGAVRRFRIPDWQESIARKLELASSVYTMLKGENDHARSLLLEITVVALIVIEVLLALFVH